MRHDWKIGTTIDECINCGILRRTLAVKLGNSGFITPHPVHEYYIDGKWTRPKDTKQSTRVCNPVKSTI